MTRKGIAAFCTALLLLIGIVGITSKKKDTFNQELFEETLALVRTYYESNQTAINALAEEFQAHKEIDRLTILRQGEKAMRWAAGEWDTDFKDDYPQIYDWMEELSKSAAFSLSRSEDEDSSSIIIFYPDGSIYRHRDRFCNEFFTSFHFQFSETEPQSFWIFYTEQVDDTCWLVVENYPVGEW